MLKFHPPYFEDTWQHYTDKFDTMHPLYNLINSSIEYAGKLVSKDLFKEHKNKHHYNYIAERILLQPWAPTSSSEARLIISRDAIEEKQFKLYDSNEWEDRYFVLRYIRMYSWIDTFQPSIAHLSNYGYDGCYDCFIELSIIYQYLVRSNAKNVYDFSPNQSEQISMIDKVIDLAKLINLHLRYDLKNKLNKSCQLHGSNIRHKHNYFYIKIDDKWNRWTNRKLDNDLNNGLHEHFDTKNCDQFKTYMRQK
jgi:hypothetical protein